MSFRVRKGKSKKKKKNRKGREEPSCLPSVAELKPKENVRDLVLVAYKMSSLC